MAWTKLDLSVATKADMEPLTGEVSFYADHNVDASIVYVLEHHRYDVESAADVQGQRQPDEFHFRRAFKSKRVLLTQDKDYLDNSRFPLSQTCGVVVFNVDTADTGQIARALQIVDTIFGGMAPALRQKKFVVNSDYTITMIERVQGSRGWEKRGARYRFDTNGQDVWVWEDE